MREVYEAIAQLIKEKQEFVLVMVVNAESSTAGKKGFKMIVFPDGKIVGTVGGGTLEYDAIEVAKELFKTKGSIFKKYNLKEGDESSLGMVCGGEAEIYIEYVGFRKQFIIFGGGHLGKMLYEMAGLSKEYDFVIIDERPEFASKEIFKDAEIFSGEGIFRKVAEIPIKEGSVIVIVTPGGAEDPFILKGLYERKVNFEYFGMIGSVNRRNKCFEKAKEMGVPEEFMNRIFSPVGIAINADTPFEISVSILAELIAQRKEALQNVKTERSVHEGA